MLIDAHIHIFPDKVAPKAAANLSATAGVQPYTDMTEANTRRYLEDNGIDYAIAAPIATKPSQEESINDWAAAVSHGRIRSLGTIYPGAGDPVYQVQGIVRRGLPGVKLHPDYQSFFVDETALYPLYEALSKAGLPVLFHAGRDPLSPHVTHCTPAMLRRISEVFPELRIIGAHLGGNEMYDAVERDLVGSNVYLDISLTEIYAQPEQLERIIKAHGAHRILFATDTPWSSPQKTVNLVNSLDLSEEERERIFWKNAAELYGPDLFRNDG